MVLPLFPVIGVVAGGAIAGTAWAAHRFPRLAGLEDMDQVERPGRFVVGARAGLATLVLGGLALAALILVVFSDG